MYIFQFPEPTPPQFVPTFSQAPTVEIYTDTTLTTIPRTKTTTNTLHNRTQAFSTTTATPVEDSKDKHDKSQYIIGGLIGCFCGLLFFTILIVMLTNYRKRNKTVKLGKLYRILPVYSKYGKIRLVF